MNKRAVNISSLVILLSLLCFIMEVCMYYFIPQHYITVLFAAVVSLGLSHFFLESSLNYDYNFIHASFMVITALAFAMIVYIIQPNEWIHFDFSLVVLVLINWIIPFLYCCIRDLTDRGPRFDGYHIFFHRMSVFFIIIYLFALIKQYFITPIIPPYEALKFGAHDFIPFMATGSYIEKSLKLGTDLLPLYLYMAQIICLGIPFGYFSRIYLRKLNMVLRIIVYLILAAIPEVIQSATGLGRADLDDYVMFLIGALIGVIIFHIMNGIFQSVTSRDFMLSRDKQQKHFY